MADLDRLIRVELRGPDTRDENNRAVPGAVTFEGKVWASLESLGNEVDPSTGLLRESGDARYRVRWRQDLRTTPTDRIKVIGESFNVGKGFSMEFSTAFAAAKEDGAAFNVMRVEPVGERRRFLDLTLVRIQ